MALIRLSDEEFFKKINIDPDKVARLYQLTTTNILIYWKSGKMTKHKPNQPIILTKQAPSLFFHCRNI